MLLKDEID